MEAYMSAGQKVMLGTKNGVLSTMQNCCRLYAAMPAIRHGLCSSAGRRFSYGEENTTRGKHTALHGRRPITIPELLGEEAPRGALAGMETWAGMQWAQVQAKQLIARA